MRQIKDLLQKNTYPGRGIVLGRTRDGSRAVCAYFIMGRSQNSRNRIFREEGEGLRTEAFDPEQLKDPSLIIYRPVRVLDSYTIVTNGDQTDTIYDLMKEGLTFEQALATRTFEPDAPNYTPRISGLLYVQNEIMDYSLSILKSAEGSPVSCHRYTFSYQNPQPGRGHIIHTYEGDGDPLPSFSGEPRSVSIGDDMEEFTRELWESLDEDNRISLFTRFIHLRTGETLSRICNKNEKE